jgi:hypothetical protein
VPRHRGRRDLQTLRGTREAARLDDLAERLDAEPSIRESIIIADLTINI